MRYWLEMPQGGWVAKQENVQLYALLAEVLGFDGVWVGDHIVIPQSYESQYPYGQRHPVGSDRPFLEAYTLLSYVAGMTERIRLAVTVTVASYRHPLLLAKIVATLDMLSGGRVEVGFGSGWLREEFDLLGVSYVDRHRMTDECAASLTQLWSGEPVSYSGDVVQFSEVQALPRPTQVPHPPFWFGGTGRRALDRVESFGAGWLGPDLPVEVYLEHVRALQEVFAAAGRPLPRVSAKVSVARRFGDEGAGALAVATEEDGGLELLTRLAEGGTSDIRVSLSRCPSRERPEIITALARALSLGRHLDRGA